MKNWFRCALLGVAMLLAVSCVSPKNESRLLGEWGMTSGSTKIEGAFTVLDKQGEDIYYKTMSFSEDGSFTATADGFQASGTYEVISSSSIRFTYNAIPEGAPKWFAFRKSGTWMYEFLSNDLFWFYDYGTAVEVAMTMTRL